MRSLYTFAAAAAITLAAAEAQAQSRAVVLFPTAPAPAAAAVVTPTVVPISTEKTLTWPGKRESRYSPRTAAPGRQAAPVQVVQAPAPVVVAAPEPRAAVYAPAPQRSAPLPAYVYAPTPRYAPAPALPNSIYDRPAVSTARVQAPAPQQPVVVAKPRVEPAPVPQPAMAVVKPRPDPSPVKAPAPVTASTGAPSVFSGAAIPDRDFPKASASVQPAKAVAAATPAPAPVAAAPAPTAPVAPVKTAEAATSAAAPREPWRTRASNDGPRFYSVHRQFGVAPDPTRVSAAPTSSATTDRLPNDFFIGAGPNPDEAEAENVPEQTQQQTVEAPKKKRKQPIRKK